MAASPPYDKKDVERRMKGAVGTLKHEFAGLRTGRASPSLLDPVQVPAYGNPMPINQVGTVSAPEPRLLTVQVWDRSLVKAVDKAIRDAGLGLNPAADGNLIRVPLPELSEERRKELVKVAHQYGEKAKIAIRNIRRDGMDELKKMEKGSKIAEDEHRSRSDEIQKLTDQHVQKVDESVVAKEKDILQG